MNINGKAQSSCTLIGIKDRNTKFNSTEGKKSRIHGGYVLLVDEKFSFDIKALCNCSSENTGRRSILPDIYLCRDKEGLPLKTEYFDFTFSFSCDLYIFSGLLK